MSRLFLALGGAGMILFSYLFGAIHPDEPLLAWDRLAQALLCGALWGFSFALPLRRPAVQARWLTLIDAVAICYGLHTVAIFVFEGLGSVYLLSTLIAVQLIFLLMRSMRLVQVYTAAVMGLVSLLLAFDASPPALRLFIGLGFAVLCAVNYAAAHARLHAFERLANQQALMQDHISRAQQAEQLLQGILESALSGVMAFRAVRDAAGQIADFEWLLVNRAAEQMVGFEATDLLGRRLLEVMPGNREEGLFERYVAVVETGKPLVMEHYYDHERVSRQWFHTAAVKLGDGFAVTFSDISARKQAEEKLRDSESLLRSVMDASPAWIFIKDNRHRYRLANEACAAALGMKPEDMIGKNDLELGLPPEEVLGDPSAGKYGFWTHDRQVLESGQPFRQEAVFRSGPRLLHLSTLKLPLRDAQGDVWGILGFVQDVSAHKRSEAELRKLSLVARHTNTGVVITNAAGQIEWVNEGFVHLTGYELDEVAGKKPGTFLQGPETDPQTVARIGAGLQARVSFREDILNYHKNGSSYWISLYITPVLDERGEVEYFIAIENDISLQKQAEAQLRLAKEAAEAAAAAKAEFLANMSHEIRTPMNAVIGLTGLLLDSALNEEQREYVEIIRNSGDNLLTVINDILDFSKIESGKLELERQPFRLHETIEDILDLLSSKAQEKGLELIYRIAPDVPVSIVGDPTRLSQVLMNLTGNAIKFTREGEVEISVARFDSDGGLGLRFEVRDTGIGIPPDKMERLFKSFSQVDASTTRQYGGTGLGLAISQRLVQMMGGEVGVRSTPGAGSVFSFTLRTEAAELPGSEPAGRLDGLRALILDDNRTNLTILREQLAQWGSQVQSFDRPADALRSLADAAEPVDLVITDMQMPEVDGYGFARQLRSLPARAHLPLIVLTSMGEGLSEEGRQLFDACLSKPVRRQQLLRHIRRALRQGEPASVRPEAALAQDQILRFPSSLRILLAEDNMVNQKVASRILEKLGLHCDIAANGSEALTAVDAKDYDLILMDMQMPLMDGITATRYIRQRSLHQPLIIAMTANAMTGDRERCLEAGMNDYISKPVKLEDVAETLARWFVPLPAERTPAR